MQGHIQLQQGRRFVLVALGALEQAMARALHVLIVVATSYRSGCSLSSAGQRIACTCNQGYYKNGCGGFNDGMCTPCGAGKYATAPGSNSATVCLDCSAGNTLPSPGRVQSQFAITVLLGATELPQG